MLVEKDKIRFKEIICDIAEVYNKKINRNVLAIYWGVLHDKFETIQEFENRAYEVLHTAEFMPKPKDFLPDEEELELIASKAYNSVLDIVLLSGSLYAVIEFEDKIIHSVIENICGSWKNFYQKVAYRDSNDTFVKRDFIRAYIKFAKYGVDEPIKSLYGYVPNKKIKAKVNYKVPRLKISELTKLGLKNEKISLLH